MCLVYTALLIAAVALVAAVADWLAVRKEESATNELLHQDYPPTTEV